MELALFKNKCEKLIKLSWCKDNIIHQLLLDLRKVSAQNTCHPQTEVSVEHQELVSVEYNINPPKHFQNIKPNVEPSNIETWGTIPKKKSHVDNQIKEVRKHHHQKFMHSEIPITEKNVIPTTSESITTYHLYYRNTLIQLFDMLAQIIV